MNWKLLLCFAVANCISVYSRDIAQLRNLLQIIQRRLSRGVLRELDILEDDLSPVVEPNNDPDDLPRDEPTPPGHTLIKPASDTLESAAKYPHKDVSGSLVYGNLDNLGITYGKTRNRILYSGFRRSNNVLEDLIGKIQEAYKSRQDLNNYPVIILIKKNPNRDQALANSGSDGDKRPYHESDENPFTLNDENSDAGNDAREILDMDEESSESDDDENSVLFRRRARKHKSRQLYYATSYEINGNQTSAEMSKSSSEDESSDYEKNPGNPYTVHKNRYKQNWMWNFAMTGDHMNVNPKAPQFNSLGPTGADLFFGRKWWYFNQKLYYQMMMEQRTEMTTTEEFEKDLTENLSTVSALYIYTGTPPHGYGSQAPKVAETVNRSVEYNRKENTQRTVKIGDIDVERLQWEKEDGIFPHDKVHGNYITAVVKPMVVNLLVSHYKHIDTIVDKIMDIVMNQSSDILTQGRQTFCPFREQSVTAAQAYEYAFNFLREIKTGV